MYTFDLKTILFIWLALLALVAGGAIWLDRRQRRQPQADLHLSLLALNEAPFGVLWLQSSGAISFANLAAQRLLGLNTAAGALPDIAWADQLLSDASAARNDRTATGRYRIMPLPPDRQARWWASAGGELIFLFDTTDQLRAEQAARQLLSDLSHELRTPLATILTHVEVQGLANLPAETRQESWRLLRDEAQRAARLVNGMLELGRVETSAEANLRLMDLLPTAASAVQQMMPQADARRMHLSLDADSPLLPILGDADQLLRVFLNLLENAVKFCRPGDRILATLRNEGQMVRCAVCDTGPGIAPQHIPFLTHRFYRAGSSAEAGSGLGLALVEEILRRHHSALHIESRVQAGEQAAAPRAGLETELESSTGVCVSFALPAAPMVREMVGGGDAT